MDRDAADRASRDSSIVLSLCLPGDTLLYLLLPLYPEAFGVTLAEAGILLAANRIVRIIGYGWVARLYSREGPRLSCILAAIFAAVAALGYALLPGFWALIGMRLIWGLCFASLNIATQALPTAEMSGAARRSGRSRSIISIGPMLGLVGGALLAQWTGPRPVFFLLAAVALAGIFFARRLPGPGAEAKLTPSGPRFTLPSRLDQWAFVQGLMLDGLFVIGLSVLALREAPDQAVLAAGLALALRYACEICMGSLGGRLAERHGARRMLVILSIASAGGLALIGFGGLWVGVILVALLRGLLQPLPAPVAAAANPGEGRVRALAELATWRDLGAGCGPLIAGLLLPIVPAGWLYGGAGLLLALSAARLLPTRPPPVPGRPRPAGSQPRGGGTGAPVRR